MKERGRSGRGMRRRRLAVQLNCYDIIRGDPSGIGSSFSPVMIVVMLVAMEQRRGRGAEGEESLLEVELRSTETAAVNHSFLGSTI